MSLPTVDDVAARARITANDPRAAAALAIALDWARERLSREPADPLSDLNAAGNDAVAGYAVDVLKVPSIQLALADVDNLTASTIPFDIGRRWELALTRGNKHVWAIR